MDEHERMALEGIGIWSSGLRDGDPAETREAAVELQELGYRALWMPGGAGGPVLERARVLLEATTSVVVATGILNVWRHAPADVAHAHAGMALSSQGRFLLGLGISHARSIEEYRRPLATMRAYLDALDAQPTPVPPGERVLAALGPRMLDLARERTAGAHPYFVPPEHTRIARERLGHGPLLAPEQAVTLDGGRDAARAHVARYLELPNYTNNLRRLGFAEEDLRDGGSDRLLDAIVAQGPDAITARVREHREAGADHVCLQVVGAGELPRAEWRELAALLRPGD